MEGHYSAFISYKHEPEDIRVAVDVQRRLEHFTIPAALRKKLNRKEIGQIFRDQDELPITGDLTEQIMKALRETDCLIVICSPKTRESAWVAREIDFFLEYHDLDQVMTVLVSGEPGDVIPPALLSRTKTVFDGNGKEITVTEEVEPLYCDYRNGFTHAAKEEIPRLAAGILGCGYDELRQRQRQYHLHRMLLGSMAAGIAAVALAVYFWWGNIRIQEHYREVLKSQSISLASNSASLLEEGDRKNAISLALEALPGEGRDRPVTTEAVHALANAVSAYQLPYSNFISPEGRINFTSYIYEYLPGAQCTRLFTGDYGGQIQLWDMDSQSLIRTYYLGSSAGHLTAGREGTALLTENRRIYCVDENTGDILWQQQTEDTIQHVKMLGEDELIVLLKRMLLVLDPESGEIRTAAEIGFDSEDQILIGGSISAGSQCAVSTDGQSLVCLYGSEEYTDHNTVNGFVLYEKGGNSVKKCAFEEDIPGVDDIAVDSEDHLYIAAFGEDDERLADLGINQGSSFSLHIRGHAVEDLCCFDSRGKKLWEVTENVNGTMGNVLVSLSPSEESVLLGISDDAILFSAEDGKQERKWSLGSPIAAPVPGWTESTWAFILEDGTLAQLKETLDIYKVVSGFPSGIRCFSSAPEQNGDTLRYLAVDHERAFLYKQGRGDEEYGVFDGAEYIDYTDNQLAGKRKLLVWKDDGSKASVYDGECGKLQWKEDLSSLGMENLKAGGFNADESRVFLYDKVKDITCIVDCESGEIQCGEFPCNAGTDGWDDNSTSVVISDGICYYFVSRPSETDPDRKEQGLCVFDPFTGEFDVTVLSNSSSYINCNGNHPVSPDGKTLLVTVPEDDTDPFGGYRIALLDIGTGELTVPEDSTTFSYSSLLITWLPGEKSFAVAENGQSSVSVFQSGELKRIIRGFHGDAAALHGTGDRLIIVTENGAGYLYRLSDGRLADTVDLGESFYFDTVFTELSGGDLMIYNSESCIRLNTQDWSVVYEIPSTEGILEEAGKVCITLERTDGEVPGFYPIYSLQDLIEKGERLLDGWEMDQEVKVRYGLSQQ